MRKLDKKFTSRESRLDALNLKRNQRSTRLLCKVFKQNDLSDC